MKCKFFLCKENATRFVIYGWRKDLAVCDAHFAQFHDGPLGIATEYVEITESEYEVREVMES
jgi:hypothetical protein